MTAAKSRRKLTYRDYAKFRDDRRRHEVLDGMLVVAKTQSGLGTYLLSAYDVLEPDLLFVSKERLWIVGPRNFGGSPDLVAEILSPRTRRRDLGEKRAGMSC